MFFQEARAYIEKLIRLQAYLVSKGYARVDQPAVLEAKENLKKYLDYYHYDSDEKMRNFFESNHDRIKALIPGENYRGYQKLMQEFMKLQNQ
jgi:hypothetical protein